MTKIIDKILWVVFVVIVTCVMIFVYERKTKRDDDIISPITKVKSPP